MNMEKTMDSGGQVEGGEIIIQDARRDSSQLSMIRNESMLEELESLRRDLQGLDISVYTAEAFGRLSELSHVSVRQLRLENIQGLTTGTLQLKHNIWRSLLTLTVFCEDAEAIEFVDDAKRRKSDTITCPIEYMVINGLSNLKEVISPWRGVVALSTIFCRLRTITIACCPRLEKISWLHLLPSLVELFIVNCNGLEWLGEEEEEGRDFEEEKGCHEDEERSTTTRFAVVAFPSLKKLELYNLPNLRHMSWSSSSSGPHNQGLPALEELEVSRCPKLKRFPFPSNSSNNSTIGNLRRFVCDPEWWEGLEWNDDNDSAKSIKASLDRIRADYWKGRESDSDSEGTDEEHEDGDSEDS